MPNARKGTTTPAAASGQRVEHDLLGERAVPIEARYGAHTSRALENFRRPHALRLADAPEFARAFGMVKLAALRANVDSGVLDGPAVQALEQACQELTAGDTGLVDALVVPLLQGGAGTSTNMCVNEVLANRALELLGREHGDYSACHPNDHVNRSQSTNDVYPTALHLALIERAGRLGSTARDLEVALRERGAEYSEVRKLGRTQLQDAVPMTVGQELEAWAKAIAKGRARLEGAVADLHEVNLGGTAIGTGLTTPVGYQDRAIAHLVQVSGRPVLAAADRVAATTDVSALLGLSSALRHLAIAAAKVANDLRLLASGPETGLAEYQLPAVQAGSSMMPGKVNPVIAEFVNQLAFRVRGADATVALALDAAQLQLNAMLPVVAEELLGAEQDLSCGLEVLRRRCVKGLTVDAERLMDFSSRGLGELSELATTGGYAAASQLAVAAGRSQIDAADD